MPDSNAIANRWRFVRTAATHSNPAHLLREGAEGAPALPRVLRCGTGAEFAAYFLRRSVGRSLIPAEGITSSALAACVNGSGDAGASALSRVLPPGSAVLRPRTSRLRGVPGGTFTRDWVSPSNGALCPGFSRGGYLISPDTIPARCFSHSQARAYTWYASY